MNVASTLDTITSDFSKIMLSPNNAGALEQASIDAQYKCAELEREQNNRGKTLILASSEVQGDTGQRDSESPIVTVRGRSTHELVTDLALEQADAVFLERKGRTHAQPEFAGVCALRPFASAWCHHPYRDEWGLIAGGRFIVESIDHPATSFMRKPAALRPIWLQAWAQQIAVASVSGPQSLSRDRVVRQVFVRALTAQSIADIALELHVSARQLRDTLRRYNVRGPKRFLVTGRVFTAWEWLRTRTESFEHTALRLGFASLSAMDHATRLITGHSAGSLRHLGSDDLLPLLVSSISRNDNVENDKYASNESRS